MSTQQLVFPLLWFTSGTVINTGQRECDMERWLGYHAGRHGTGYRRKAQAIPLATGGAVHKGLELIGQWILDWQIAHPRMVLPAVPDDVTAWAATEAAAKYENKARARGLELTKTDLDAAPAIDQLILEQRTLIEALVWVYAIVRLPIMLSTHRLVNVEHEEDPVFDCTCGLGDWIGGWQIHASRGCHGIVDQGRGDFIWELLDGSSLVYEEFKTKAVQNYGWEQAWEHSSQLLLNMEAASRRLGKNVNQAYVPILFKGKRDRTDRDDKTTPKIQQSPLVYGWFDPGNGMTRQPEWAARYKWWDDWGKGHTLGKTFKRTPIWDETIDSLDWAQNPNGVTFRQGSSRVERWIRGWILPGQYPELMKVLGPFPRPVGRVPDATVSLLAEERRWRDDIRWLRDAGIFEPGDRAVTEDGQVITAADLIARSWHCTKFDGSSCQFKRVCLKEDGWQDLRKLEKEYEIRTPHHSTELQAMEPSVAALGLQFRDEDADEDGAEE